jgi:hypothetical protein
MADDLLRFCDQECILARRQRAHERLSGVVRHALFSSGLRSIAAVVFVLSVGGLGGLIARLLESNRHLASVATERSKIADQARRTLEQAEHAVHEMREYWADRRVSDAVSAVDAGDITTALHAMCDAIEFEPVPRVEKLHRTRLALLLRQIPAPVKSWKLNGPIRRLAFSPDGSTVTAVSSDDTVVVLPIEGRAEPLIEGPDSASRETRSSPGATRLIAVHTRPTSIVSSDDGTRVVAGFDDGLVRLFESTSIRPAELTADSIRGSGDTVSPADASRVGNDSPPVSNWRTDRWEAVLEPLGGGKGLLRMIDAADRPLRSPIEIAAPITAGVGCGNADCVALAFAADTVEGVDGNRHGSRQGVIRLYRFPDSPPETLTCDSVVKRLQWCDAGQTLIVVCERGTIELVSLLDRPKRGIKVETRSDVTCVTYDPTLELLAAGGVSDAGEPFTQIWESVGGQPLTHRIARPGMIGEIEMNATPANAKFHCVDGECWTLDLAPIGYPVPQLRSIAELYSGTRQPPRGGRESLSLSDLALRERELRHVLPSLNRP